jgi:hypothetical protein
VIALLEGSAALRGVARNATDADLAALTTWVPFFEHH